VVLPNGPLQMAKSGSTVSYDRILGEDMHAQEEVIEEHEDDELLIASTYPSSSYNCPLTRSTEDNTEVSCMKRIWRLLRHNLKGCRNLFIP
jgi:hypothetical protein